MAQPERDMQNLRESYEQLCVSYRAIDEFRAKLLGFLPFVTGGGVVLLTGRTDELRNDFFVPVGLFGVAVTVGLLAYELYGIRKCAALIGNGIAMEIDLGLRGQFRCRPNTAIRIVNEPFAAAVIYPAVLAVWVYVSLFDANRPIGTITSLVVFGAGLTGILLYDNSLRDRSKDHVSALSLRQSRQIDRQDLFGATSDGG